ncbi:hypothetical protein DXA15_22665 [Parabacteroides sp. AM58-2XD]|nr:hypothetical protein DXA15_22665 [Parabacteroides sp. AM58-2XD]
MGRYKKTRWSAFTSGPSLINQNLNYEKIYVFHQQMYNLFFNNRMEILLFFLKVAFLTFLLVACR